MNDGDAVLELAKLFGCLTSEMCILLFEQIVQSDPLKNAKITKNILYNFNPT